MKISKLKGAIRTAYVEVPPEEDGGAPEQVEFKYRPGALTIEMFEKAQEAIDQDNQNVLVEVLKPILVSWDIQDEDPETGEEFTLDTSEASIKKMPIPFLAKMLDAIMDDSAPDPKKPETSVASSEAKDGSGGSLTGTL